MASDLKPVLADSDIALYRSHANMTPALRDTYGCTLFAGEACARLLAGYQAWLVPMQACLPQTWESLQQGVDDACIIEMLFKEEGGEDPCQIRPVIPSAGGFCSFGLYGGVRPLNSSNDEYSQLFHERVSRAPDFLQTLYRHYERISFNRESVEYMLPDVQLLESLPFGSSRVKNFLSASRKRTVAKRFSDLDRLLVVAMTQHDDGGWMLFFDDTEEGDRSLFVAFDKAFSTIGKITHPEETYDLMCHHYVSGKPGDFDFRPFVTS